MSKSPDFELAGMNIVRNQGVPVFRQIYQQIRHMILKRRLLPGQKLPSTRVLAQELKVSRTTVLQAFDLLLAEGYISGRTGSGSFVTDTIPEEVLQAYAGKVSHTSVQAGEPEISRYGNAILGTRLKEAWEGDVKPFRPGIPALREFPLHFWQRIANRQMRFLDMHEYAYGNPSGYKPLREALAGYLRTARAVDCSAEQIIIVNGSQQTLDLTLRLLLDPGDVVWCEDPGYGGAIEVLRSWGLQIETIAVERNGWLLEQAIQNNSIPKLIYVTPSHQYPMGVTMSLTQRLQLLEWAAQHGSWILEDDYDSEFRYESRPISSFQGLDQHERVIYSGTFSKVLFPAIRIGYIVVPAKLVEVFRAAKALTDRSSPIIEQVILTAFIEEGHFGRHIRRMRMLYHERQRALIESIERYASGLLKVESRNSGLHMTAGLDAYQIDRDISARLARVGVTAPALSSYALNRQDLSGLVLGYAAFERSEIEHAVKQMAEVLR